MSIRREDHQQRSDGALVADIYHGAGERDLEGCREPNDHLKHWSKQKRFIEWRPTMLTPSTAHHEVTDRCRTQCKGNFPRYQEPLQPLYAARAEMRGIMICNGPGGAQDLTNQGIGTN